MSAQLPYRAVADALRPPSIDPASPDGIDLPAFVRALAPPPMAGVAIAVSMIALSTEDAVASPVDVAEAKLSLEAMSPEARAIVATLAGALAIDDRHRTIARRAMSRIGEALGRALGAKVAPSVLLDVTLFEVARRGAERCEGSAPAAEWLARTFALQLGLPVRGEASISVDRLAAIDPRRTRREAEARSIEERIRKTLPKS